jgi:cytochrome c oxidase subunit 4
MSTASHAETGHSGGHGHHDKPEHHPHVLPLSIYFAVFGALIVFTGITVAVSYVDFGAANLVIAVAVATMKASMVSMIFMHLWWDKKFNAVAFLSSLVFLGVFIGLTMVDTETRGRAEPMEGLHPADMAQPFAGTKEDAEEAAARARAAAVANGTAPAAAPH